jgi:probable F420-dependent oxidoreductase
MGTEGSTGSEGSAVKVRIGVGAGAAAAAGGRGLEALTELVDALDRCGFDSLWLAEVLTVGGFDPLVGLSWAAAHSQRVKLGTTMMLPGRNPVRLAKSLASLDVLSGGRLLVTFVPGLTTPVESSAIGVPADERSAAIEEVLPLLRRLWAGETVSHHGQAARFEGVRLEPLPAQQPLEAWLGGMARSAQERCGRLSDGWLPSMCTPDEVVAGRRVVDESAAAVGREISPEHFGVSIAYAHVAPSAHATAALAARSRGHDPAELVPVGLPALREHLERFIAVGFSKFVVRPLSMPASWDAELDRLASAVGDLQS